MTRWEEFFKEKITHIFTQKSSVIDIGGGLRAHKEKGNRYDPTRSWATALIEKVDYKVLDPVPDYKPDIIGDIHNLPFADNSQEAILCIAVLEHVENPIKAVGEMYRVLKPGGYCFAYVPFLYYYHADPGYYNDYWRFTKDALAVLFKDFSKKEMCSVRGATETWLHLSPLGRISLIRRLVRWVDRITGKTKSNQVSGYYIYAKK